MRRVRLTHLTCPDILGTVERTDAAYTDEKRRAGLALLERDAVERRVTMNIQIFGTKKCFDTKKAERYFKERRVKYQMIDLREKGMSRGELQSVAQAVKGLDNLLDPNAKDQQTLALVKYLVEADRLDKVFENQQIIKTPVVRNGRQATVGYQPDVWKSWE